MKAAAKTILTGQEVIPGIEEKLKEDTRVLPELGQKGYEHKREQFYLMHADGRTDAFISRFLKEDLEINTLTMDVLRMAAKFCGESFTEENLFLRSFSLEEVISKISDELMMRYYEKLPDIRKKLDEADALEKMLSSFREFMEGFRKENPHGREEEDRSQALMREQIRSMKQQHEISLKMCRADLKAREAELEKALGSLLEKESLCSRLKAQVLELEKEAATKDNEIRSLQASCRAMRKLSYAAPKRQGFFSRRRRKKQDEEAYSLIMGEMAGTKYSEEQMDVLIEALGEGFIADELKALCNPDMKVEAMKKMKELIEKKREGSDGR